MMCLYVLLKWRYLNWSVCVPSSFYWRVLLKTQDISVDGIGPYLTKKEMTQQFSFFFYPVELQKHTEDV